MLVFRRGQWMEITLPFSDPMLTSRDRQFAASVAASRLVRGASQQQAERVAETALYKRLYGPALRIPGEQHSAPKH
jgi:hypothetical protein